MGGSDPSHCCEMSQGRDRGDGCPPLPGDKGVDGGLSGVRGVSPWCSGTVGVFTGIIGGLMGMGPKLRPPGGRRRLGLDDGVRRMVATPGVMMADGLEGKPAVEAGRLDWNMRRYEWLMSLLRGMVEDLSKSDDC